MSGASESNAPDVSDVRDVSDERAVFVEAEGVRLRAVLEGEQFLTGGAGGGAGMSSKAPRPVLVLHGFTGSAESMAGVSRPLARARCVARLELVGHGESEAPEDQQAYSMTACASQVKAAAAALGFDRPHLLGYSMGGRTALAAGVAYPRAFSSLVLIGATAGLADRAEREARIAADEALADRIEGFGLEAFVDAWMALPIFASQARLGDAALARARAERMRNRPEGLARSLRGMGAGAQPPQHARLADFPRPVLLVVGEEDEKFRRLARGLEAGLPKARTAVIPGVGHAAHLEDPVAFAQVVREFLGRVEGAGSAGPMRSLANDDRPRAQSGDANE